MTIGLTRRHFLYGICGAGATLAVGSRNFFGVDRQPGGDLVLPSDDEPLCRVVKSGQAFGTGVSITAWHVDESAAAKAAKAAFDELTLIDELLSIYRPDSQLSQLNRNRELHRPHPYLLTVLRAATEMSGRSGGAFDITVQPLWQVYAAAKRGGRLPDVGEIEAARRAVDWRRVDFREDHVRLLGEDTQITLNGIAQGFATDRAAAALIAHGVTHALIDAGEIAAVGNRPGGESWSVGVQHPRQEDAYLAIAGLAGRCLATSGDYATSFSDDLHAHHLFDPRSGQSPAEFASVSIAAKTGMLADAMSTAVFVLGLEAGMALVESTPDADALVMLKDGHTLATRGWPRATANREAVES